MAVSCDSIDCCVLGKTYNSNCLPNTVLPNRRFVYRLCNFENALFFFFSDCSTDNCWICYRSTPLYWILKQQLFSRKASLNAFSIPFVKFTFSNIQWMFQVLKTYTCNVTDAGGTVLVFLLYFINRSSSSATEKTDPINSTQVLHTGEWMYCVLTLFFSEISFTIFGLSST